MAKSIVRSDETKSLWGLQVNGAVFFTSIIIIAMSIFRVLFYRENSGELHLYKIREVIYIILSNP